MKTTTIRELKHETGKVLGWVARGETVEVQRRRKPIARLCPPDQPAEIERPDFVGRLRAVYRTKTLRRTGTAVVSDARGES